MAKFEPGNMLAQVVHHSVVLVVIILLGLLLVAPHDPLTLLVLLSDGKRYLGRY